MAGGDGGLQGVRAPGGGELVGPGQRGLAPPDVEAVPRAAVLVEQQDGRAGGANAGAQAGGLELHEGDEAVHLGLVGHEGGEHAAEAERLAAELGPHPVLARGGRVALVEDEVDDLEHGARRDKRSSPTGTSNGTPARAMAFLARTMRCAIVASGTT